MRNVSLPFLAAALIAVVACMGVPDPSGPGGGEDTDTETESGTESDEPEPTETSIPGWELAWAARAGGDEHAFDSGGGIRETGQAIAPDTDGSVFLVGQVGEGASFGEGNATEVDFPDAWVEWSDGFIARYGPDGEL